MNLGFVKASVPSDAISEKKDKLVGGIVKLTKLKERLRCIKKDFGYISVQSGHNCGSALCQIFCQLS